MVATISQTVGSRPSRCTVIVSLLQSGQDISVCQVIVLHPKKIYHWEGEPTIRFNSATNHPPNTSHMHSQELHQRCNCGGITFKQKYNQPVRVHSKKHTATKIRFDLLGEDPHLGHIFSTHSSYVPSAAQAFCGTDPDSCRGDILIC